MIKIPLPTSLQTRSPPASKSLRLLSRLPNAYRPDNYSCTYTYLHLHIHLFLHLHLLQQPALLCYETLHLHVHNTPCTPAIQPPPLPVLHPLNAARCLYGPPQLDAGSVGTLEASDPGPNGRPAVQPSAPIAPPSPSPSPA
ncbi:uncharacterized protein K444DRAFT_295772 [Hyaloscypha bicolor E]|uniref:Uncharacterized protein n=1 Tax=Hyaloscypha bicolor E TaxID=1095630 RepID=A0A2J6SEQ0_9HELO|nr:uncharacterized protein K444DRAFT_295772 [Hyaloscypha bicolor E]PMD49236.1 hypothetical protein K444DRAFT_295772 [Hyaloscypha bicolor E]